MKTKICESCKKEYNVLFRIQKNKIKAWIFVCEACCIEAKLLPDYKYGGTWKGNRH